ncbi:MAG: AAA family ATPase [Candidatus Methanomethylicia archaeon]
MLKTYIEEVILENFMSYEYARIPFKRGLNLIVGPNGAGKSTILVGISIAMGQTYTERAKRLKELIRYGKKAGRVTILLNNEPVNGVRPIQYSKSDTVSISRYLKDDGTYWYEMDYRQVSKSLIDRVFRRIGINPDNMLIIMHQGMIERFSIVSPQDRLLMVEEAVGIQEYRRKIFEASEKLNKILSEEESVNTLLKSAEQTLSYWREQYEKLKQKRELQKRKQFLEREEVWARIIRYELSIKELKDKLQRKNSLLQDVISIISERSGKCSSLRQMLEEARFKYRGLYHELIELERRKAKLEVVSTGEGMGSIDVEVENKMSEIVKIDDEISRIIDDLIRNSVDEAIYKFQKKLIEREIEDLRRSIVEEEKELLNLEPLRVKAGERINTMRTPSEVLEELRYVNAQLIPLTNISDDVENIYNNYLNTYNQLNDKINILARNREEAIRDFELRLSVWRKTLEKTVEEVDPVYKSILSMVGATGQVRIRDIEDPSKAGLEVLVGYGGTQPTILDAYTQSGGERVVATIAFLLSLQHHLKSPIRAIDEFDVHMDPYNREIVARMIFDFVMKNQETQYIVISPSQITFQGLKANTIIIQKNRGRSEAATLINPPTGSN